MIESPVLQKWRAEAFQEAIVEVLKDRFGTVPRDVVKDLRELLDDKKLRKLIILAGECRDVEVFRKAVVG